MRRLRRSKIVATLGPASSDPEVIAGLFDAGADVFRINMSHTSHDRMRELVATIRGVETQFRRPIGILVDLQGPKLRVGTFAGDAVMLQKGATFVLDDDPTPGTVERVQLPHHPILIGRALGLGLRDPNDRNPVLLGELQQGSEPRQGGPDQGGNHRLLERPAV